jgi:hypothetical protein
MRLPELQAYCPLELVLEAVLPGGRDEEHNFHRQFDDDRIRGEWFKINELIEAMIANNPPPPPPPKPERGQQRATRKSNADERERLFLEKHRTWKLRQGQTTLKRLEAAGDIHFPYRET